MSSNDWIESSIQPSYYYVDYYEDSVGEEAVKDGLAELKMDHSNLFLPLTLLSLVVIIFTM